MWHIKPNTDRGGHMVEDPGKIWIPAKSRRVFNIISVSAGEYSHRQEEGDLP